MCTHFIRFYPTAWKNNSQATPLICDSLFTSRRKHKNSDNVLAMSTAWLTTPLLRDETQKVRRPNSLFKQALILNRKVLGDAFELSEGSVGKTFQ